MENHVKTNDSNSNLFVNQGQLTYKIPELKNQLLDYFEVRLVIDNDNADYAWIFPNAPSLID